MAGSVALACCASCWQGRDGPTKAEAFFPQKWRFLKGTFSSWCRKLCSQKHTNPSQPCLSHLPSLTQETPSALKLVSRGCINLISNCDKGLCFTARWVFWTGGVSRSCRDKAQGLWVCSILSWAAFGAWEVSWTSHRRC